MLVDVDRLLPAMRKTQSAKYVELKIRSSGFLTDFPNRPNPAAVGRIAGVQPVARESASAMLPAPLLVSA